MLLLWEFIYRKGGVILSKTHKRKAVSADGEDVFYESSDYGYKISNRTKIAEKIELINELMDMFPSKVHRHIRKNGTTYFDIFDRQIP